MPEIRASRDRLYLRNGFFFENCFLSVALHYCKQVSSKFANGFVGGLQLELRNSLGIKALFRPDRCGHSDLYSNVAAAIDRINLNAQMFLMQHSGSS